MIYRIALVFDTEDVDSDEGPVTRDSLDALAQHLNIEAASASSAYQGYRIEEDDAYEGGSQ